MSAKSPEVFISCFNIVILIRYRLSRIRKFGSVFKGLFNFLFMSILYCILMNRLVGYLFFLCLLPNEPRHQIFVFLCNIAPMAWLQ
jgi:hypothetical protein